jgi:hypothetical protein
VASVLGRPASDTRGVVAVPPPTRIRGILLDPTKRIELEDLVSDLVLETRERISDNSRYPTEFPKKVQESGGFEVDRFLARQTRKYLEDVAQLADVLVMGCQTGEPHQDQTWARAVQNIANSRTIQSGATVLFNLQYMPTIYLTYCAALAAVSRGNYGSLRAVTVDAKFTNIHKERNPVIGAMHTLGPFENRPLAANLLAFEVEGKSLTDDDLLSLQQRGGKRHTPVSDFLCATTRALFARSIPDDDEYYALFDRTEVLLGIIATYEAGVASDSGRYIHGAWYGSFTWRDRWSRDNPIEKQVRDEIVNSGAEWPGVEAGLFRGSAVAAQTAADEFMESAALARRRRW